MPLDLPTDTQERRFSCAADAALAVALAAVALLLRLDPLGPSSLWIDDAWAALVSKADSAHDVLLAGVTAPGFAALLKAWLAVVGFSELRAQLLPFVVGVVTPPLLYLVLRRAGAGRLGASVGALVLVGSSVHMTYSTRVKQYTIEGLVALGVLAVAWWLVRGIRQPTRWWVFAATCVGGIVLASSAIALAASSTAVALALLARDDRRSLRAALAPAGLLAVFAALWWWFLLRPRVTQALENYWAGYFVPHDEGLRRAAHVAARDLKDVAAGAINLPSTAAVLSVVAAVAILLVRRRIAPALLFVIAPCGLALILAAARAVPLGTGRTDLYLYPGLAMAIGLAVDELRRSWARLTAAGVTVLVVISAVTFDPVVPYPPRDVRPLVAELERRMSPTDSVLVRPDDIFAFALYSSLPVTFVRADAATGFAPRVDPGRVHAPLITPTGPDRRTEPWQKAITRAKQISSTIWLLVGGRSAHPTLPYARRLMRNAGLSRDLELTRPGASLSRWSNRSR
jgi:hypothetical protein